MSESDSGECTRSIDTNPKPVHDYKDVEFVVETTASSPATCTETARQAIETARTLSPLMHNAARHACENHEGRWIVVGRRATLAALERRGMVAAYLSGRVAELNDFGRFVHVAISKGEAELLAWAEQKDAEAKPRQGHHNRTDVDGTVHRVDVQQRALCDITLTDTTILGGGVTCLACIDAMFTDDDAGRRRYLMQRPGIARAAGLRGLDDAYRRAAADAEDMSNETLNTNIDRMRRWAGSDAFAAERLRAYLDAAHTQALAEYAAHLDPIAPDAMAESLNYASLTVGQKIRSTQSGERAEIISNENGTVEIEITDVPDQGESVTMPPADVITYWRKAEHLDAQPRFAVVPAPGRTDHAGVIDHVTGATLVEPLPADVARRWADAADRGNAGQLDAASLRAHEHGALTAAGRECAEGVRRRRLTNAEWVELADAVNQALRGAPPAEVPGTDNRPAEDATRRARAKSGSTYDTGRIDGHPWPIEYAPRWSSDHHPWRLSTQHDFRYASYEVTEKCVDCDAPAVADGQRSGSREGQRGPKCERHAAPQPALTGQPLAGPSPIYHP